MTALSGDLQSADRIDEYRQAGDLILAHLKDLRTGMEQADLTGYDGNTVSVILDPKRSPSRNAELYFKKYKKARTGRDIIAARLRQASDEAAYLKSLLNELEQAKDADALMAIRSELVAKGYFGKKPSPLSRKTHQGSRITGDKKNPVQRLGDPGGKERGRQRSSYDEDCPPRRSLAPCRGHARLSRADQKSECR